MKTGSSYLGAFTFFFSCKLISVVRERMPHCVSLMNSLAIGQYFTAQYDAMLGLIVLVAITDYPRLHT